MTMVDVNELVSRLLDFLAPQFAKNGITAERKLTAGLPWLVLDPDLMQQAILNIALNAIKAMPDGGRFTVETRAEPPVGDVPGSVRLVFSDSGEGISAENLSRIFSPFFTTRQQGTGLGLSITQRIVEQHNGDISVQSDPGHGAVFSISLPYPETTTETRSE
jgi:signal transduction histidine kinase